MKALVTGGAGFIGSNIVESLLSRGFQVVVFDDFSTGMKENLAAALSSQNLKVVKGDIRDYGRLKAAAKDADVVFHLAAQVGNVLSLQQPQTNIEINAIGTLNVLRCCKELSIKSLVYSSSCAIFGETKHMPINEDHSLNPVSPYGISKLAGEQLCLALGPFYGIKVASLRYFNVYGKNQRFNPYGNVLPIFAEKIKKGEPLTVYGDGNQTRDFVDVRDVVAANLLALEREAEGVFNIATGVATTVNTMVKYVTKAAAKKVEVVHAPPRAGEVRHSVADIRKAKAVLKFFPKIRLEQGINEYFEWFNG